MDGLVSGTVSGVVSGLVVAVLWAALVWLYDRQRNRAMESAIRLALQPKGVCFHINGGVGIDVANPSLIPVIIRAVLVKGKHHTFHLGLHKKKDGIVEDAYGWVELPPHTKADFSLNYVAVPPGANLDWKPLERLIVVVEFRTLLGETRIIEISPTEFSSRGILQCIQERLDGKLLPGTDGNPRQTTAAAEPAQA